ncbi:MAG: stage 0 sporulation family protein [Oscillospiraceae bacterium]|nr:stage 0 sporulation family protein [Oscillospiraceae bacterium]
MDELKRNERESSCQGCGGCPCAQEAALGEAVDDALAQELLPELPEAPAVPARVRVVDIRFRSGGKIYFFDPGELELKAGDHVIIDTARGAEYGICASGCHTVADTDVVAPLRRVLRAATEQDERVVSANREKEKRAYDVCLQKIQEHKLEMQLVSVECAFDGSKILFFFTADGRVDFRELVKNLASVFRTRIELRQIGVRDKAKMVGGLGVCGRPFCCSQFLDDFQPVSIKMAKTQNLSLNPTKISGTCGRLMCCLKYEQEAYEDLHKTAPRAESFVDTPEGRGTVCDVNLLRQTVRVRMEDHPETIGTFRNSEIAVLRSGKAKKTDPPVPRDLAPISGQPRRAQRETPAAEDTMPLMFKRLDEYAASTGYTEPRPEGGEEHGYRRSRRRRHPAGEAKPPQQEPKPQQSAAEGGQKPKSNRRRRSRRPKNPGGRVESQE